MTHYAVQLNLIQYCQSTKPQFKKKKKTHKTEVKDIGSLKLKEAR